MEVVRAKRDRASSIASAAKQDGRQVHRGGLGSLPTGRFAICFGLAVLISHSEARAAECTLATPACHLENGERLLKTDPKRAAEELLASFKLDERTDTLALYATALELQKSYAHALETWQRVIVFRESELDAAKAKARKATGRKLTEARAAVKLSEQQMEEAGQAIMKLRSNVGRVRIQMPAGEQIVVTRVGGAEVDPSKDVLVNSGRDELVFTRKDGNVARVVIEAPAGGSTKIDAPEPTVEKPKPLKVEQPKPTETEPVKTEPVKTMPEGPPKEALSTVRYVEEPRSRTMSRVGLGFAAGAVIVGGIAGTFGYLASSDFDDAQGMGCSSEGQCPIGPATDLAQRSNDRARVAQITAIGAGALLATGAVMWVVGRGKTRRAATDVTVSVGPSTAAIGWRF